MHEDIQEFYKNRTKQQDAYHEKFAPVASCVIRSDPFPDRDEFQYFVAFSKETRDPKIVKLPLRYWDEFGPTEIGLLDYSLTGSDFYMVGGIHTIEPKENQE
jgi:hypothetical protein